MSLTNYQYLILNLLFIISHSIISYFKLLDPFSTLNIYAVFEGR